MNRYAYECPDHGEFEVRVPMSQHENRWPCPAVGCSETACRQLVRVTAAQFVDPTGFAASHVTTTGLKTEMGTGDWDKISIPSKNPFATAERRANRRRSLKPKDPSQRLDRRRGARTKTGKDFRN